MVRGWLIAVTLAMTACVRDPVEPLCPELDKGELVVTEIRGEQGEGQPGPWIELYNASDREIDLQGLKIRFRRRDGSSEIPVLVRRSVPHAASGYLVLSLDDDETRPTYSMYGFAADFNASWLSSAAIDVESCGTQIDRVLYDSLPSDSSLRLGSSPPHADDNDIPTNWCAGDGSIPDTPNGPNLPCP
jgi:hypothetical protein